MSVSKEVCVARTRGTDLPFSPQDAHLSEVNAVRFGPSSSLLATGGADRLILLWNVVGGEGPCPQASLTFSLLLGGKGLESLRFLTWDILVGSGKSSGLTAPKKGRASHFLKSRPAGWGGLSSDGPCWGGGGTMSRGSTGTGP